MTLPWIQRTRWAGPVLGLALLALVLVAGAPSKAAAAAAGGTAVAKDFGEAGVLDIPGVKHFDNWAYGFQAAALPNGGTVVAGYREVLELGPEGLPFTGFGTGGTKRIGAVDGRRFEIRDVAVDSMGRIVLFGSALTPADERRTKGRRGPSEAAVIRLLPGGSYDPSFGGDGVVHSVFDEPPTPPQRSFVIADQGTVDALDRPLFTLPAERPVVSCDVHERYFAIDEARVVRLGSDGAIDSTFHGAAVPRRFDEGAANFDFEALPGGGTQLAATGDSDGGCPPHPLLIQRRLADGQLDRGFGPEGVREYEEALKVRAVTPYPDGGLLVLGPSPYDVAAGTKTSPVERLTPSGRVDRGLGNDGVATVTIHGFRSTLHTLLADSQGRIYVVGTLAASRERGAYRSALAVERLEPNGQLDPSFGNDGLAIARIPNRLVFAKAAVIAGSTLVVIGIGHPYPVDSNPADLVFAGFDTGL